MRSTSRCIKCKGTRLYVCENHQPDNDSSNRIFPFVVTAVEIGQAATGAVHGSQFRTHVGRYETWICAACGYTEWYATDREQLLEKLSKLPGSAVRVVDSSTPGPYR